MPVVGVPTRAGEIVSLDIWLECPCCSTDIGDFNYTHNVSGMWSKAGCYDALYNSHGQPTSEIIPVLEKAVTYFAANLDNLRAMNPENGWGDADGAFKFLENFLELCEQHPNTKIGLSK